jgi:hypothetical protein
MPKGGIAECPHPPAAPDTCPDGSLMPKGGIAECIPQPKSSPIPEAESLPSSQDNCGDPIFAHANTGLMFVLNLAPWMLKYELVICLVLPTDGLHLISSLCFK